MKKTTAIILASVAMLVTCAPALSGCGSGGVKFTLSEEGGKHYIVKCSGLSRLSGEYEIPAYYGEGDSRAPVTEIADEGFASTNFRKITVPETVTKIGVAAFGFCPSLETVEFAEGINLKKFSRGTFGQSANLQQIKIPDSVTTLDGLVFSGCEKLSSVTMAGVEVIGDRVFENCTSLESITLPETLTTIGDMAFYCAGLKEIEIPASVRDSVTENSTVYGLGYGAFIGCEKLETAKIGSGVTVITSGAFGYCISLKKIYIPLSVKEVQGAYYENGALRCGHAFYGDEALTDVYFEGDEEQWKDIKIEKNTVYSNGITMDNSALIGAVKHYNYED
ncbi:MAG: leucine-rich repeat domain-containing protein [Clostridia bacterium]|nr:leucine-rich repeat domain-containing protein [Clostridia bacterium]